MTELTVPGYALVARLGEGAFGTVYRALWNEDFSCAVKLLGGGALHQEYLGKVLERLMELPPHPGLLPVYAFDLEAGPPHVSMALLPGEVVTFDDLAGELTKDEAWSLLARLADSLAWLHGNGIVHAGLTGGNVFVVADAHGSPQALLADVGQAWLGGGTMESLHDQAPYVPPERWREPGRVLREGHAETWDVYAFGVLAWRLLNGQWPRASSLFDRVLASKGEPLRVDPLAFAEWLSEEAPPIWPAPAVGAAEEQARQVVRQCLELDPARRPASMQEVAAALRGAMGEAENSGFEASPDRSGILPAAGGARMTGVPDLFTEDSPPPEEDSGSVDILAVPDAGQSPVPATGRVEKPDFSGIFGYDEDVRESLEPEGAEEDADEALSGREAGPDSAIPGEALKDPLASERKGGGTGARLGLVAGLLVGGGGLGFALYQQKTGSVAVTQLEDARQELNRVEAGRVEAVTDLEESRARGTAQRLAGLAASRDDWASAVSGMLPELPDDGTASARWHQVLTPVADRFKQALEAADAEPSLRDSSMEPRWQLADLYSVLDRPDDALPLLEHLSRDLEARAAAGLPMEDEHRLMSARTGSRRGRILLADHRTMEAAPLLQGASADFEQFLSVQPERHDIEREYAVNSLLEGQALSDRGEDAPARAALTRVGTLLGLPGEEGFLARDHFILTDSLLALATLDSREERLEPAIEQHMQAVRLLVAYDQENRKSVPCRRRLADGYFGLGRLLRQNGTPRDASVAFSEAVKLLTELSAESPGDPAYRLQLALTYNEVAQLVRETRPNPEGAREALDYQNGSITILRNLNEASAQDEAYRRYLAEALVINGELHEAAGDKKTALDRHSEALTFLDGLLAGSGLTENDRRHCRRLQARALTAMGSLQESSGSKEDAIASLTRAIDLWSEFTADDPAAEQIAADSRERLHKLKPDS